MAGVPRPLRSGPLLAGLAISLALAVSAPSPRPALASVATHPSDLLSGTLFDLALVPRSPSGPPDLLVIAPDDEAPGGTKIGLFHRVGDVWSLVAGTAIPRIGSSAHVPTPWLVDMGGGRFALLSVSFAGPVTNIVPVTVGPLGGSDLEAGQPVEADLVVSDAGAADVDGDGVNELVVSGNPDEICADTSFAVFGGSALEETHRWTVPHMRLAGAAIGRFSGGTSAELLAHAYETCPITPDSGEPHHLIAIRLADGVTVVDLRSAEEEQTGAPLGMPLVVDVDGDGRDEAVVRTGIDLALIDPSRGWTSTTLGVGDAMPLAALGAPGRVLWVAPSDSLRPAGIATIERSKAGRIVVAPDIGYPATDPLRDAVDSTFARTIERALSGKPPPATILDLDGDGCPEILAPKVIAPCLGVRSLDPGPAWLATVPLAVFDGSAGPTVLVALGLRWDPGSGDLPDPTPVAAGATAAWRHGPSIPFSLTEAQGSQLSLGRTPPGPVVDAIVAADGSVGMSAMSGARLLVRARPLAPGESVASDAMPAADLLATPPDVDATAFMTSPLSAGDGSGSPATSFDVLSLPLFDGSRADRWLMDVALIDPAGDVGGPVRVTAVLDVTAPALTVTAPFLSPTWPLETTLHGHSENGALIRLGDGEPFRADATGAFEVATSLAPWPQALEFTAADAHGNVTTVRVSAMGGVDVRQLPWAVIVTVTLLLAAAATSVRGARRGRSPVTVRATVLDEPPQPEIEELSVGALSRRD